MSDRLFRALLWCGYHCGPASGLSAIHTWFGSCVTGLKGAFKFAFTWVPVGFHLKLSHR